MVYRKPGAWFNFDKLTHARASVEKRAQLKTKTIRELITEAMERTFFGSSRPASSFFKATRFVAFLRHP